MSDEDYITYAECDSCHRKTMGVMFHCRGTPVMFLCPAGHCGGGQAFERLAAEQKQRWLSQSSAALERQELELAQSLLELADEQDGVPSWNEPAQWALNSSVADGGLPVPEPGCNDLESYFKQLERAS